MTLSFQDRVALVTGGGNGLGRDQAIALAGRGAAVVVNDVVGAAAAAVVAEIERSGGQAVASADSVAAPHGAATMVQVAVEQFGRLDIVVHSAGVAHSRPFVEHSVADFHKVLDVNLLGAFLVMQSAVPVMRQQQYGRIVLISSSAGLFGRPSSPAYNAAKLGVVGLMHALAMEPGAEGMMTNCVAPTAMTQMAVAEGFTLDRAASLLGSAEEARQRFDPANVTSLVTVLASEQCPSTRHIFSVAAGRFARVIIGETQGWLPERPAPPTAEEVHERWDEITALTTTLLPESSIDELLLGRR